MFKYKKYFIYIGIIGVLIIGIFSINLLNNPTEDINGNIAFVDESITTLKEDNKEYFYVDVKGAVKTPGVYKAKSDMIVNDLIKMAGGLTKNAYTNNINLATKVTAGMVIYVYNKNEMKTTTIKNDVIYTTKPTDYSYIEPSTNVNNGLININTASKEELMSITGVGESKAIAIIEYRTKNKFITIEDIMNVSGIGESLFVKIKEYITV